jgi:exosortase/archaeosortase family protein
VNKDLTRFIVTSLGIFVAWYLLYDLWILPDGRVDHALSLHIIAMAKGILELKGYDIITYARVITLPGANGIEMVDGCNGIEALGLFVGFVVAFKGTWKNRAWVIPLGLVLIYLVNIVRVVVLVITQKHAPSIFTVTHDYSTTAIFYIVIFAMWVWWSKLSEKAVDG